MDHSLSKQEKERLWLREQASQVPALRSSIDSLWQHIAFLAAQAKIKPKDLVKSVRDTEASYKYLMDCVKEEQSLQQSLQKKANKLTASPEAKETHDNN